MLFCGDFSKKSYLKYFMNSPTLAINQELLDIFVYVCPERFLFHLLDCSRFKFFRASLQVADFYTWKMKEGKIKRYLKLGKSY